MPSSNTIVSCIVANGESSDVNFTRLPDTSAVAIPSIVEVVILEIPIVTAPLYAVTSV